MFNQIKKVIEFLSQLIVRSFFIIFTITSILFWFYFKDVTDESFMFSWVLFLDSFHLFWIIISAYTSTKTIHIIETLIPYFGNELGWFKRSLLFLIIIPSILFLQYMTIYLVSMVITVEFFDFDVSLFPVFKLLFFPLYYGFLFVTVYLLFNKPSIVYSVALLFVTLSLFKEPFLTVKSFNFMTYFFSYLLYDFNATFDLEYYTLYPQAHYLMILITLNALSVSFRLRIYDDF
jgi:hypothetical protein